MEGRIHILKQLLGKHKHLLKDSELIEVARWVKVEITRCTYNTIMYVYTWYVYVHMSTYIQMCILYMFKYNLVYFIASLEHCDETG